jgi:predicted nucleic acid-binding Zn finger protein
MKGQPSQSPTNYNGLVIVIEGEHHGKYLRRLLHEGYKASALMIGAVVKRIDGQCDHFTGEEIKISTDSLCVVEETKEEVNRMKDIMLDARHAYKEKMKLL